MTSQSTAVLCRRRQCASTKHRIGAAAAPASHGVDACISHRSVLARAATPADVHTLAEAAPAAGSLSSPPGYSSTAEEGRNVAVPQREAIPQPGTTEPAPSSSTPWPAVGVAAIVAAASWLTVRSGIIKTIRDAWRTVSGLSEEDTEKWLQEMKAEKKAGKSLAERVEKLQVKMGNKDASRGWSEVQLPSSGAEPSTQPTDAAEDKYAEMNKVLRDMQEGRDTRAVPPTTASSQTVHEAEPVSPKQDTQATTMDLSSRPKQWWERKSAITVVGYRTAEGDVEYMEMDVALEEDDTDERFLAFEDKDDAKTILAALRAIARSRGIPVPFEDDTTGHFNCLVSPDNVRMLEEKVQKEVLVFRKRELALRVGMDETEIRGAVMKAVFQRPRTPRYRPLRRPNSSTSVPNQREQASSGAVNPSVPFGPEVPSSMLPDLPLVSSPQLMDKPAYLQRRHDSQQSVSSSLATDSRNGFSPSDTSATTSMEVADSRGQLWWRGRHEVWVIQLSYQTGASGIFQCDIGLSEDETRLSIIAFEDCAAAETVCRLSQQWADLTADAVQAKGTAMRPDDLMRLARQTQSDVTVLKGTDLRGLHPAMTPDDLADLIMAAVNQ